MTSNVERTAVAPSATDARQYAESTGRLLRAPSAGTLNKNTASLATLAAGSTDRSLTRGEQPNGTFVGRVTELSVLDASLRAAVSGEGRLVLIGGEPGIGKTRLAERIATTASALHASVLWGRCWEGDGAPSFWPWIQVLRNCHGFGKLRQQTAAQLPQIWRILEELGIPFPATPQADAETSRFWLFDIIFNLLQRAASEQPLLIALDDLHWADPASLLLLQFLASEIATAPFLIIGTYRDVGMTSTSQLPQVVASVSRHRWTRRLHLQGLSTDEVGQFIEYTTKLKPTSRLIGLFKKRTGGNPFFLTETVRLLGNENRRGRDTQGPRQLPDTVREAIAIRLESLSSAAVALLRIASVIGEEFDVELLGNVADQFATQLESTLECAVKARLLISPNDISVHRYRFAHALVREFLYEQVPAPDQQRLHAQLATALERKHEADSNLPVAEIAFHYAMAGSSGDPQKAFAYSVRAGEQAALVFAYEDATSHFNRALVCDVATELRGAPRCELLLSLGEAQKYSGSWENARETFMQAASVARSHREPKLLARAAIGLSALNANHPVDQQAVALLREALSEAGTDDSALRVQLLATLAFCLHFDSDPAARLDLSAAAIACAKGVGDPSSLAEAFESEVGALVGRCSAIEFERLTSETVHLAERCGDRGRAFRCRMYRYAALLQLGETTIAEAEFRDCVHLAKELRYPKYLWQVAVVEAGRAMVDGRFDLSARLIEEAVQEGQQFNAQTADQYRVIQQTFLLHAQGDIGAAEPALRGVVEAFPDVGLSHAALADACAVAGNVVEAREMLTCFGWSELQGIPGVLVDCTLALLAEAVSIVRDSVRASVLYRLLLPRAAESMTISWGAGLLGSTSHYLGLLSASLDKYDQAVMHFEKALQMNHQMRAAPLVACTQRHYAEVLLQRDRDGDRALARVLVEKAMSTFADLGMGGHWESARATWSEYLVDSGLSECCLPAVDACRPDDLTTSRQNHTGAEANGRYYCRREADFWTIVFDGRVVRLRHRRGLAMLWVLLQRPDTDVHVLDLVSAVDGAPMANVESQRIRRVGRPRRVGVAAEGHAGPLLDARARAEYQGRASELRSELLEAERFNDLGRSATLRTELEQLVGELKRAYGQEGRSRLAGAASERARINVRNNLSTTLSILKRSDPALWRHLHAAVRTGTFCSYQPERAIPWVF